MDFTPIILYTMMEDMREEQRRRLRALHTAMIAHCDQYLRQLRLNMRSRATHTARADVPAGMIQYTPWGRLWIRGSNTDFIAHFGLHRSAFLHLLATFRAVEKERGLFLDLGESRGSRPCSISSEGRLALVLLYLVSTYTEAKLCLFFSLPPATLSSLLWGGLDTLQEALKRTQEARVDWPSPAQLAEFNTMIAAHAPVAAGAGAWGTAMEVETELEESVSDPEGLYTWEGDGRKLVVSELVFAADGTVVWVRCNVPGGMRDTRGMQLFYQLEDETAHPRPFCLVADAAYDVPPHWKVHMRQPLEASALQKRLKSLKTEAGRQRAVSLQAELASVRQAFGWSRPGVSGPFGRLRTRLMEDKQQRGTVLAASLLLHNYRVRRVGLDAIRAVFENASPHLEAYMP